MRASTAKGFPGGSDSEGSACNAGDLGSIPGPGRQEEGMATHSRIVARRIPWTEEPGGPQSMGLQRVRHDRATNTLLSLFLSKSKPQHRPR